MSFEFMVHRLVYLERRGHWRWLKMPVVGASVSEFGALVAQVDWMHVFPAIGLAITAIGTAVIGLWRYYRLSQIEIEIRERQAAAIVSTVVVSQSPATVFPPPPGEAPK